ncbi:phosphoethanolamine N-methyltransferase-like [Lineus longissimus]|uniref:phosphoethanolamine N-methyltransferase-like n=1 Tax=Lineus longissimus TaxID=88925 RepID=UPI002B4CF5FF
MDSTKKGIKEMKLYEDVHRIYKDLAELSYGPGDKLDVDVVSKYDQYHYHGTEAIDEAIKSLGITEESRVLDVGSGIGGPARYLAKVTNCQVMALDLQQDLNAVAEDLTKRCGLADRVTHKCGDIMVDLPDEMGYDFVVSWLVFLHIPDKASLFDVCRKNLKSGGKMFIEDFFAKFPFTDDEKDVLAHSVFCRELPTKEQYEDALKVAGFVNIKYEDVTEDWLQFVQGRANAYMEESSRHARVYGEVTYMNQQDFYNNVVDLFKGGHLGGAKIEATRAE